MRISTKCWESIIPNGKAITDIEKLLTQCKLFVALYGEADANGKIIAGFITKAESAILARVDFIDAETDLTSHQAMLRKLVRRGVCKPRTKLFTTNYDLAFEYAARLQRIVVIDGFSYAAPPVFDRSHFGLDIVRRDNAKDAPDYLDSVVQLYKLHGSIDCPIRIRLSQNGIASIMLSCSARIRGKIESRFSHSYARR